MTVANAIQKSFGLQNHDLELLVSENELFMPNATTRLFSKAVYIDLGDIVFDIGSGVGPLAIWAAKEQSRLVYAVEIVEEQCELLRQNIIKNKVSDKVIYYQGRFFDPIPKNVKANVIIADVSGIAEGPARVLGWYPPSIPTGGEDGTGVIIPMLEQAGEYLLPEGRLYFPIAIGLSDDQKIMKVANEKFGRLEIKENPRFPLEQGQVTSLKQYETTLPFFKLGTRGSRTVWEGRIYEATNPRY